MRNLLDENFPLSFHRVLRGKGYESEHIIELGLRGASDRLIMGRLAAEELLFLTQDADFLDVSTELSSVVMVSRVSQDLPTRVRVEIWLRAIETFAREQPSVRLFEIDDEGRLHPWRVNRRDG